MWVDHLQFMNKISVPELEFDFLVVWAESNESSDLPPFKDGIE